MNHAAHNSLLNNAEHLSEVDAMLRNNLLEPSIGRTNSVLEITIPDHDVQLNESDKPTTNHPFKLTVTGEDGSYSITPIAVAYVGRMRNPQMQNIPDQMQQAEIGLVLYEDTQDGASICYALLSPEQLREGKAQVGIEDRGLIPTRREGAVEVGLGQDMSAAVQLIQTTREGDREIACAMVAGDQPRGAEPLYILSIGGREVDSTPTAMAYM
jgi:hypothetical protein